MKKDKDQREALIKGVDQEALKSKFIQDVGSKVRVERTKIDNAKMDQLREVLSEIGQNIVDVGAAPKGMDYLGSFSVHVYKSDILRTIAYVTLNADREITFDVADGAMRELNGNVQESHGRSRQKLRSGF